jgi:LAS superfamily LD-carboxypeptidase LdcB
VKLPIKPVVLPADLARIQPGQLPNYLLRPIRPYGQLHWLAAQAYEAMRKEAHRDGIRPFKPTSTADTYRSLAMQERGFLARYTQAPIATTSVRTYQGKKWYLKPGLAPMATPGKSTHNLGLAVDISQASGDRLQWLLANADKFGFCWELQVEPWHIRYFMGDRVPLIVQRWIESHANRSNSSPD